MKDLPRLKQKWQEQSFAAEYNPVASSESLSFATKHPYFRPWEDVIPKIAGVIDLSGLKSLNIGVYQDPHLLMDAVSTMPNLEPFFFDMHPRVRDEKDINKDEEGMVFVVLELNLPRFLTLGGLRSFSSLRQILLQHGPTLEDLMFQSSPYSRVELSSDDNGYKYSVLTGEDVAEIADLCPNLQELYLPIKRQGGKAQEREIYSEMGKLSYLHTLLLEAVFDRTSPVPSHQALGSNNSTLKEAFINSAFDEKLMETI